MINPTRLCAVGLAVWLLAGTGFGQGQETIQVGGEPFLMFAKAEAEVYDAGLRLEPRAPGEGVRRTQVVFAAQDADNLYRLKIEDNRLSLWRRAKGQDQLLTQADLPAAEKRDSLSLLFQRRQRWLAVLVNDQERLRTFDGAFFAGRVGISAKGQALKLSQWRCRPIGRIEFNDDFMRTEREGNQWETLRGLWKLHTVREGAHVHPERRGRAMEPGRSANYFSYEGFAENDGDWALCAAGDPVWQDYEAAVSARSRGGAVGLAVGVHSPEDFLMLRWRLDSLRVKPALAEIVCVQGGKETVLGRVMTPGAAHQWYRMGLAVAGRRIIATIDSQPVMDVMAPAPVVGRVGLYAAAAEGALFDDIAVSSNDALLFDTAAALALGKAEAKWSFPARPAAGLPQETQRVGLRSEANGVSRYWLGDGRWHAYALESTVTAAAGHAVALAQDRGEAAPSLVLRCTPSDKGPGMAQLLARSAGKETELARAVMAFRLGQAVELGLDTTEAGAARGFADGRLLFRVEDAKPAPGRPMVECSGPAGAHFADTAVRFCQAADASLRVRTQLFARDRYMVGWAAPEGAWELSANPKSTGVHWHKSDFFGPFLVHVPAQPGVTLYLASDEANPLSGYVASLESAGGQTVVSLKQGDKELARAPAPPPSQAAGAEPEPLVFGRESGLVWCFRGDKDLFCLREADPPSGVQIGVKADKALLTAIQVTQFNVKDYLFAAAPWDWHTVGAWEVTNRFACDPRWSWYSATAWDGLAMAWNKNEYEGDLTIEFYAGMRMETQRGNNYPRPGEINATICGDGKNLASGYSIIINGWDPMWTGERSYLYRKDRQVSCAYRELVPCNRVANPVRRVIPVAWDPGGRPIHGAWYYVKIRKLGRRIEVYFDNVLVMAYEDPEPLAGKRVAIWTMDNSIMIARVRVAYTHSRPATLETTRADAAAATPPPAAPPGQTSVRSATHPAAVCSFETGLDGWTAPDGDEGAELSLVGDAAEGKRCLQLTNINSGGTFSAFLPMPGLDLARVDDLSFRYRIPEGVRVNLYFKLADAQAFVRLTGPETSDENMVMLGSVPGVHADGKWRAARFDLAAAARRQFPTAARLVCDGVRIGYHHPGYGLAGFEGNHHNATYWIDDFRLVSIGGKNATFSWAAPNENPVEYAFSVTPDRPALPRDVPDGRDVARTVTVEKSGLYWFNVAARAPGGAWLLPAHAPFRVDTEPLQMLSAQPMHGSGWGGGPIEVKFAPYPGHTLDPSRLKVTVDNAQPPARPELFNMDWAARSLLVDLSRSGLQFTEGKTVAFTLQAAKGLGEAEAAPAQTFRWELTYSLASDKTPPSVPVVAGYPLHLTFNEGLSDFRPVNEARTVLKADPAGGLDGTPSLRLFNRGLGGNFSTRFFMGNVHVGRAPIFSFEYCLEPVISVDWSLALAGASRSLTFTDRSAAGNAIAAVGDAIADGRWHRSEVNLRRIAESQLSSTKRYELTALDLFDGGYCAAAPGAFFRLDNIRIVPLYSSARGADIEWSAADTSGVAGYACKWSDKPDDDPGDRVTHPAGKAAFRDLPEGRLFFHVRGQDKAGNWGPANHYQYLVDNTPPKVKRASGEPLSPDEKIEILYEDPIAGLDLSTLAVELTAPALKAASPYGKFDFERSVYTWHWIDQTKPVFGPAADGAEYVFKASECADFAGNATPAAAWTMKVRYADDKQPPSAPDVRLTQDGALVRHDFQHGNQCYAYAAGETGLTRVERAPQRDYALRVSASSAKPFGVHVLDNSKPSYDVEKYPWLCFDYCVPQGVKVHLQAEVNGVAFGVNLTAPPKTRLVATIPNLASDGAWHHAAINMAEHVRKAAPKAAKYEVRNLMFGNAAGEVAGAHFDLDNVAILGPVSEAPKVAASARDLTGIAAFAWTTDSAAQTVPPAEANASAAIWSAETKATGLVYLHVRARDGAGNWGPASHLPFVFTPPPPPPPAPEPAKAAPAPVAPAQPAPATPAKPVEAAKPAAAQPAPSAPAKPTEPPKPAPAPPAPAQPAPATPAKPAEAPKPAPTQPAPAAPPKPPEPAKPAQAPVPAAPAKPAEPAKPTQAQPAPTVPAAPAKPAEAVKPAEAPKAALAQPTAAPAKPAETPKAAPAQTPPAAPAKPPETPKAAPAEPAKPTPAKTAEPAAK